MRVPISPDQLLSALPRTGTGRISFCVLYLLAWFALQFPLVPTTPKGFAINVAFALLAMGYAILAFRTIVWLGGTRLNQAFRTALGVVLAASVGIAIFLGVYLSRDFVSSNFGFHHLRELFH
jgi:hypothetical protein